MDGAHAPGQVAGLSLAELGVDYYVGNLHKWSFAPRGCGFLWVAGQHQANIAPLVTSHAYRQVRQRVTNLSQISGKPTSEQDWHIPLISAFLLRSTFHWQKYFQMSLQDMADQFFMQGTVDHTPFLCLPVALAFYRDLGTSTLSIPYLSTYCSMMIDEESRQIVESEQT